MPWAVAGGLAAGGVVSGILGANAQEDAADKNSALANQNYQNFMGIPLPNTQDMALQLQQLVSQGQLSPQQASAILQQPSLMQGVQDDPRLEQAQMSALSTLSNISNANGLDPQAKAQLQAAQISNANAARGANQANMQNAAQRGVAGSGMEFANNAIADQGAAQANQLAGAQTASDAANRQMAALSQMAGLSGQVRSQDFGEASAKAQSQNDINRFNTQAQQAVQNTNVANNNAAQQYNLQNNQSIANQNVLQNNAAQQYNKGLTQQNFGNELARAGGASGATGQQMAANTQSGQAMANLYGGLGQAAIGAGTSIYNNSTKPKYDPNTGQLMT